MASIGCTPKEIADKLGLNKSTVTRWIQAGKLERGKRTSAPPATETPHVAQTPAEWAKSVRENYKLDDTDEQLVKLAEVALALSLNPKTGASVRMTAAGRFQGIVRQLSLPARSSEEQQPVTPPVQTPAPVAPKKRPMRRTGGIDPRNVLMAVK